jgi:hypothetical protein
MRVASIDMLQPTGGLPLDLTVSQATAGFYVGQAFNYSIQMVWTGSPIGNFTLEVSNDSGPYEGVITPSSPGVVNWDTYVGSTVAAGAGSGSWLYDVTLTGVRWVRLVYTATASVGSLVSARLNPKG